MTGLVVQLQPREIGDGPRWKKCLDEAKRALANAREISLHPTFIRPMPGQPREYFDEEGVARLGQSIREVGQVYPGIVRRIADVEGEAQYELVDGERRWRAISAIGGLSYRALLIEITNTAVPFLIASIANFHREQHAPLEVSRSLRYMYEDVGMPMPEIAKATGYHVLWIQKLLSLKNLCQDVRALMDPTLPKEKKLPVSAAMQIARMEPHLQLQIARRVLSKEITTNRLPQEVVRVSKKHKARIQVRRENPRSRWKRIASLSQQNLRIISDLHAKLAEAGLAEVLRYRHENGISHCVEQLRKARELSQRCEEMLTRALRSERGT